jgi:hypothetical protein
MTLERSEDGASNTGSRASPLENEMLRLFAEEYRSLRDESAQARETQHKVLEWTVSAFAALFVAALVIPASSDAGQTVALRLLLFGLVLPLLLIASAVVWLGEIYRMERVGAYLRCRERASWKDHAEEVESAPLCTRVIADYPLLWENQIHTHMKEKRDFLSGFAALGMALVASLAAFSLEAWFSSQPLYAKILEQGYVVIPLLWFRSRVSNRFLANRASLEKDFKHHGPEIDQRLETLDRVLEWAAGIGAPRPRVRSGPNPRHQ